MRLVYLYAAVILYQLAGYMWFVHDPLFGDAISSTYYAAQHIYSHQLLTVFYDSHVDPGHPTLYAWLLAACWKMFGQTLAVTHLFSASWMLAFALVFIRLALSVLNNRFVVMATLTLCVFSTYLSLSAMVLNTSMLMFLGILSIYAIIARKMALLLLANSLMVCVHLQGTFFVLANACAVVWMNRNTDELIQIGKKYLLAFLLPLLLFLFWLLLHKAHTGWYVQSPQYSDLEKNTSLTGTLVNTLRIIWRLADYGMLPVHILAVTAILRKYAHRPLAVLYVSYMVINAVIMLAVLHNTIAHRYFFVIHAPAIILAYQYISSMSPKRQTTLSLVVIVALLSGNFLYYPGKTIGDATLAYRNYFELEKNIVNDLAGEYTLHSLAPIGNTTRSKYLDDRYVDIQRLDLARLKDAEVVLQSNINAEFDQETISYLQNKWYGTTYASGSVYVNVYLNPKKAKVVPVSWAVREPDTIEKQIIRLKEALN